MNLVDINLILLFHFNFGFDITNFLSVLILFKTDF